MDVNSKIVVIGAGLFGLTTAKQLMLEGHQDITVIDRHMPPVCIILLIGPSSEILSHIAGSRRFKLRYFPNHPV